mmetsp:Transcript_18913/g.36500  ORF Transcript_18913/g.36500 Transcript_18913/m.36500 type:complete len:858 (-) Transcript_18913:402-2975(-)
MLTRGGLTTPTQFVVSGGGMEAQSLRSGGATRNSDSVSLCPRESARRGPFCQARDGERGRRSRSSSKDGRPARGFSSAKPHSRSLSRSRADEEVQLGDDRQKVPWASGMGFQLALQLDRAKKSRSVSPSSPRRAKLRGKRRARGSPPAPRARKPSPEPARHVSPLRDRSKQQQSSPSSFAEKRSSPRRPQTNKALALDNAAVLFNPPHPSTSKLATEITSGFMQVRNLAKQFSTTLKEGRQDWSDIQQTFDKLHDAVMSIDTKPSEPWRPKPRDVVPSSGSEGAASVATATPTSQKLASTGAAVSKTHDPATPPSFAPPAAVTAEPTPGGSLVGSPQAKTQARAFESLREEPRTFKASASTAAAKAQAAVTNMWRSLDSFEAGGVVARAALSPKKAPAAAHPMWDSLDSSEGVVEMDPAVAAVAGSADVGESAAAGDASAGRRGRRTSASEFYDAGAASRGKLARSRSGPGSAGRFPAWCTTPVRAANVAQTAHLQLPAAASSAQRSRTPSPVLRSRSASSASSRASRGAFLERPAGAAVRHAARKIFGGDEGGAVSGGTEKRKESRFPSWCARAMQLPDGTSTVDADKRQAGSRDRYDTRTSAAAQLPNDPGPKRESARLTVGASSEVQQVKADATAMWENISDLVNATLRDIDHRHKEMAKAAMPKSSSSPTPKTRASSGPTKPPPLLVLDTEPFFGSSRNKSDLGADFTEKRRVAAAVAASPLSPQHMPVNASVSKSMLPFETMQDPLPTRNVHAVEQAPKRRTEVKGARQSKNNWQARFSRSTGPRKSAFQVPLQSSASEASDTDDDSGGYHSCVEATSTQVAKAFDAASTHPVISALPKMQFADNSGWAKGI